MEILVVMFIMFVISKLFGGITQQMPQDQRRKGGRPFPNTPSEWNFPRPRDILVEETEPKPSEAPRQKKRLVVSGQEKTKDNITETPGLALNNQPAYESREYSGDNLFAPENLISGIILAEILQPPKSRRGAR